MTTSFMPLGYSTSSSAASASGEAFIAASGPLFESWMLAVLEVLLSCPASCALRSAIDSVEAAYRGSLAAGG